MRLSCALKAVPARARPGLREESQTTRILMDSTMETLERNTNSGIIVMW